MYGFFIHFISLDKLYIYGCMANIQTNSFRFFIYNSIYFNSSNNDYYINILYIFHIHILSKKNSDSTNSYKSIKWQALLTRLSYTSYPIVESRNPTDNRVSSVYILLTRLSQITPLFQPDCHI